MTAKMLAQCCYNDVFPPLPVLVDFFGNARSEEEISIVLGLYQVLLKKKGVTVELLENCFKTNRLNELAHAKHHHGKSGYYKEFILKNIDLRTVTCLDPLPVEEHMPILTDDYCPICNVKGYYSKEHLMLMQCLRCLNWMCRMCNTETDCCVLCNDDKKYVENLN